MKTNILITGMPRSGKSTVLRRVISAYHLKVGFVTSEVQEGGERTGFEIETYNGERELLASTGFSTGQKVSRYFVDLERLERLLPTISQFDSLDLLYLDEIGQMQLFSEAFKQTALSYMNAGNVCVATVSEVYKHPFIEEIKQRKDSVLVQITEGNRDQQQSYICHLIGKMIKAKRYAQDPERFKIEEGKVSVRTDHGTKFLAREQEEWKCICDFYREHNLCSHTFALEEMLEKVE